MILKSEKEIMSMDLKERKEYLREVDDYDTEVISRFDNHAFSHIEADD